MKHQVSHPYKTAGKILVLCILIFTFFKRKLEDKSSGSIGGGNFLGGLIMELFLLYMRSFRAKHLEIKEINILG
jgi:hypothetical protein